MERGDVSEALNEFPCSSRHSRFPKSAVKILNACPLPIEREAPQGFRSAGVPPAVLSMIDTA
jgi:hypothetical protein